MKSGTYRAPAVRRVYIPKGDGSETRPIGIPTFEDRVLQRAVAMVLEAVYESQFYDFSYGFRPGRSAHQASEALKSASVRMAGGWVLEVDIKKFFDTLDHGHLREILSRRLRDGVILRLIGKWLNAGVLEGLALHHPETGTPPGRSHLSAPGEYLSARGPRSVARARRARAAMAPRRARPLRG
jgi:retron-type reverse transcriptase